MHFSSPHGLGNLCQDAWPLGASLAPGNTAGEGLVLLEVSSPMSRPPACGRREVRASGDRIGEGETSAEKQQGTRESCDGIQVY